MRAPGAAFGPGAMHGPTGTRGPGAGALRIPAAMQGLPLGTEIAVTTYAEDPAKGAVPLETLTATVGEVSEVAFAEEIRAAAAEAAYLQIDVGERTQRVELADTALADSELPRRAGAGRLPGLRTLEQGQTVEVAVYASAEDASPQTTLRFTYGVDSAAAFRAALNDAFEEAAVLEVTLPAQERTIDLSARPAGFGAHDGAFGPGMGWRDGARGGPGMGFQDGASGPGTGFHDGPRGPGMHRRW
jgi:opacity protein-like surface antigen